MKTAIEKLGEYVRDHAQRGACRCGRCFDHPGEDIQPTGHTADVVFFEVSSVDADAETLRALVSEADEGVFGKLDLLNGTERGYMEIGGWIGDQGLALTLMGLGSVMGLWKLMTPKMLTTDGAMVMELAGMGLITIQSPKQTAYVARVTTL